MIDIHDCNKLRLETTKGKYVKLLLGIHVCAFSYVFIRRTKSAPSTLIFQRNAVIKAMCVYDVPIQNGLKSNVCKGNAKQILLMCPNSYDMNSK